jgi:cytochrome b561
MFSAAGSYSLPWFGLFQWPRLLGFDPATAQLGEWLHDHGAWLVYAVVSLHLAAVGWHHFYKKDGVLSRMLGSSRPENARAQIPI